jgi:dTMP kinase
MYIVIEGIDGAGKSTVAPLLFNLIKHDFPNAKFFLKHSAEFDDAYVSGRMARLKDILWDGHESETDVLGPKFWILLLAAWYTGVQRCRIEKMSDEDALFISDGWYYRNIVKTLIRSNLDRAWLQSLFSTVREPDFVVLLDIDPALAWERRSDFKYTEIGRWDGFLGDSKESYCGYQGLVRAKLLEFAGELGWIVISITPDATPEDIAQRAYRKYAEFFSDKPVPPRH